eukprot:TRINITY_DN8000_c0_g1_i17.p1 TRINITY_DN8000_c0_g1~~TRINITY_DN8000_c0_g1_i17.p1  ORF type:complete len:463 (+),score=96.63 TRINITY_DN8000_c0_g1_i17:119-1507(+)
MSTSNAMQRKVPAAHRGLMDAMLFSRLEEKLQRQKKDLQAGSCEFQEIEKGINTLTHKIKGECVDLVQGISGLHAQIMQLSDTNRKYRDELSQLATIVAEKDQIISSLKNDLQSLSETHQHCEEDSNSLLSRLQTLENVLQSEIRKHKDYVSQAEALEDKWRFADAELEKAQKDARNAQSIVEQLRAEIMHQDSLLQIKDKAIQMGLQEINERALEIEKLQQSNHALQSDLAIVSNERIYLSEQKQKLSEELSATKARIQELLVESESNLRLEVDMHKSTKGMYEKACTEIKELMESNRKTAQEYDLLVRNHEDLRRQYSSQNQNQADETRKELDKLRATNQDLNQLNDSLSNEVQKLQLQISSQMEAFTLELEENSKSIQELQKKKFALETQVLALQKEIGTMKANWEAEAMQLHQLQAERAGMSSSNRQIFYNEMHSLAFLILKRLSRAFIPDEQIKTCR